MAKSTTKGKRSKGGRGRGNSGSDTVSLFNASKVFRVPPIVRLLRDSTPGALTKGVADTGYGLSFILTGLINATDITNLYDHYRIDKVEYYVELTTPHLTNIPYPRVAMCADWNNVVSPASESEVLEYRNATVHQFGPMAPVAKYTIVPRVAAESYVSAVSSGYWSPEGPVFVDTASSTVAHYGLRMYISDYNTGISAVPVLRTYARFHLSVKGTK